VRSRPGTAGEARFITDWMKQPPHPRRGRAGRPSLAERRARERRVLQIGLAISLLLHAGALVLASGWLTPDPVSDVATSGPLIVEPPRGMRAVDVVEVAAEGVPEVATPSDPERERREESRAPVVVATPERPAPDDLTAADRLAPRVVDPRLWQPMVLIPRDPTLSDVEARVAAAVELLSDSALAATEAAIRARDWTVEDADGGKWGISPGKLHLGKLTLPLPIWFAQEAEAAAAEAQWYELDRQLDRALFLESFEARVQAIRERRERERAEARGEGGGGR
jgi:hypothetical protein